MLSDTLTLAWHYLARHRAKSLTLIICLALAMSLPLVVHRVTGSLQVQMLSRADATPLVIGPVGSRFDLVLHALYFRTAATGTFTQRERFAIDETGLARGIPLYIDHAARGYPVVGTTLDYFNFRALEIERGDPLTLLGDCVVGWRVARQLGLEPGDLLPSDTRGVFDIAGGYPLNMRVAGILKRSHSPDDDAVFVDLKTAWVIEGIGHGHDDVADDDSDTVFRQRQDDRGAILASPELPTHTRITPENIASFHFHGDAADYPLTAIIAVPHDARSATLLLGRYVENEGAGHQALRPEAVVHELLGMVVALKRFFDVHHFFLLAVTGLLVILVMLLSQRLRRQEVRTMVHIGCSRGTIARLQGAELLILLIVSTVIALLLTEAVVYAAREWMRTLTG